jgi:hypothetical protein
MIIYDSRAIPVAEWHATAALFLQRGFELINIEAGVAYIRKPMPEVAYQAPRVVRSAQSCQSP